MAMSLGLLAGCSGNTAMTGTGAGSDDGAETTAPAKAEAPKTAEPVTLSYFDYTVGVPSEDFQKLFVEPTKKKYPNITLQFIEKGKASNDDQIAELVTSGNTPDLIGVSNFGMPSMKNLDLLTDITPLAKQQKIDLNRFDASVMDSLKVLSDKGELYGLPYALNFSAMYYNKDIFNKFGVAYPKDGITWDDAYDLTVKLTRNEGGTQYQGFGIGRYDKLGYPLGLVYIDVKKNAGMMNTEPWKRAFELSRKIEAVPGNVKAKRGNQRNEFMKDKTLAMLVDYNLFYQLEEPMKNGLDWDMAEVPSYPDKQNISGSVDVHATIISKSSKHKDEAMQVLGVLTSDEVQTISAGRGRMTTLTNEKVRSALGKDIPFIQGKNIAGVLKGKYAKAPAVSPYRFDARAINNKLYDDYLAGKIDVNTALRQADEEINQMIKTKSGK
jgi:multiple sugar transport system substrate-binding protein